MTLQMVFILLLITLVLLFGKRIFAGKVLLCLTLAIILLIGTGIVPQLLLSSLQTSDLYPKTHFGHKTAIVLLGFGSLKIPKTNSVIPFPLSHSRIDKTASLYNDCKNEKKECTIIISGGDPKNIGQTEASVYQEVLVKLNVDPKDIILEPNSNNTFENAKFTNEILKKYPFDTIYLVTSGFHSKRANLYFSHFGLKISPYPADYLKSNLTFMPSAYNFTITDLAMNEYIGILRYHLYNYLKLNVEKTND